MVLAVIQSGCKTSTLGTCVVDKSSRLALVSFDFGAIELPFYAFSKVFQIKKQCSAARRNLKIYSFALINFKRILNIRRLRERQGGKRVVERDSAAMRRAPLPENGKQRAQPANHADVAGDARYQKLIGARF